MHVLQVLYCLHRLLYNSNLTGYICVAAQWLQQCHWRGPGSLNRAYISECSVAGTSRVMIYYLAKSFTGDLSLYPWFRGSTEARVYSTIFFPRPTLEWGWASWKGLPSFPVRWKARIHLQCSRWRDSFSQGQLHASTQIPFQSSFPRPMKRASSYYPEII